MFWVKPGLGAPFLCGRKCINYVGNRRTADWLKRQRTCVPANPSWISEADIPVYLEGKDFQFGFGYQYCALDIAKNSLVQSALFFQCDIWIQQKGKNSSGKSDQHPPYIPQFKAIPG
jgi:hypothetical protein